MAPPCAAPATASSPAGAGEGSQTFGRGLRVINSYRQSDGDGSVCAPAELAEALGTMAAAGLTE